MPIKYFAFDTETTGLHPHKGDQIISLAYMLLDEHLQQVVSANLFVQPTVPVSPEAAKINGYTPELWAERGAITQRELALHLVRVFRQYSVSWAYPLGQNVGFDVSFLEALMEAQGVTADMKNVLAYHKIDTIGIGAAYDHAHKIYDAKYNLSLQCERYGIPLENAHDALADLQATVELFRVLSAPLTQAPPPPPSIPPRFLEKTGEDICFSRGKHCGTRIECVDRGYVRWLLKNLKLRPEERTTLEGLL